MKEGLDVPEFGSEVKVEDIDVVEVGSYAFEALDDLADHHKEPPEHSVPAVRYDEPLEKSR